MQLSERDSTALVVGSEGQAPTIPPDFDAVLDIVDGKLVLWYRRPGGMVDRRRIRDIEQFTILHRRIVRENGLPGSIRLAISNKVETPETWTRELAVVVIARNVMAHLKRSGPVVPITQFRPPAP